MIMTVPELQVIIITIIIMFEYMCLFIFVMLIEVNNYIFENIISYEFFFNLQTHIKILIV